MRILLLSNLYPPYSIGGYEQWCKEVAEELASRGHQVIVLTSQSHRNPFRQELNKVTVYRQLTLELDGGLVDTIARLIFSRKRGEEGNRQHVINLMDAFKPDIAMIWGMWNVSRSIPALVEELIPKRVVYYFCDYWPTLPNAYIQRLMAPARRKVSGIPKQIIANIYLPWLEREKIYSLKFDHPICVSRAVKQELVQSCVPVQHAQVVYGGISIDKFAFSLKKNKDGPLKLMYAGRLTPDKGIQTALNAAAILLNKKGLDFKFNIYGSGHSDYEQTLRDYVLENSLDSHVTFFGNVPQDEIPRIMSAHDILVFPSEWQEPFARSLIEAMAAGLLVIGTTTGGSGEILADGITGLVYSAGDAHQLADQIQRADADRELLSRLSKTGRRSVNDYFTLDRMVDQFEEVFVEILQGMKYGAQSSKTIA